MFRCIALMAMIAPMAAWAELPWGKDLAGDRQLPPALGIGIDFFTMDQDYQIDALSFQAPGLTLTDPALIRARNDIHHFDIKFDAWLFPFLNVFAIYGQVDGGTEVDLSRLGLPLPVSSFDVDYDGDVYGGGITLALGGDRWFSTLTATRTETSLSGQFDSSVEATAIQPRLGLLSGNWQYWVGGFYLDAEESHSGAVDIPFVGKVPFSVELSEQEEWNYTLGVGHAFGESFHAVLELGFGDRDTTLFNVTYRF